MEFLKIYVLWNVLPPNYFNCFLRNIVCLKLVLSFVVPTENGDHPLKTNKIKTKIAVFPFPNQKLNSDSFKQDSLQIRFNSPFLRKKYGAKIIVDAQHFPTSYLWFFFLFPRFHFVSWQQTKALKSFAEQNVNKRIKLWKQTKS